MIAFLDTAAQSGFMSPARRAQLLVAGEVGEVIDMLGEAAAVTERKMTW